jgi:hypothetical protein
LGLSIFEELSAYIFRDTEKFTLLTGIITVGT